MLDRKHVTNQPELIRAHLKKRHAGPEMFNSLDQLVKTIALRQNLQRQTDEMRAERNSLSKQIGPLMKAGNREAAEPLKEQVRSLGDTLAGLEKERKELEAAELDLLISLPNLLADDVPEGANENDNAELRRWGTPREFDFEVRDHVLIGEITNTLDFERAAKLSGARFPVYRGAGAKLERALISYFLDQAEASGYTEVLVPYIVSRTTMTGTGQLPKFEEDLFRLAAQVNGEDAFLIPTAEVPVTNLHRDEILAEEQLPIDYCSFTPCFRSEAGSYGRDVRGLIRQHQFHKVELVRVVRPEDGPGALDELTAHSEGLLKALGLPFRTVALCGGDVSFVANKTIDLEVWLPSQNTYREISSCSLFTDFQARRMALRYRPKAGGKPIICHTINGSALAVGRTVVAILENYQEKDGSITVPEVLRTYMGGLARIPVSE